MIQLHFCIEFVLLQAEPMADDSASSSTAGTVLPIRNVPTAITPAIPNHDLVNMKLNYDSQIIQVDKHGIV